MRERKGGWCSWRGLGVRLPGTKKGVKRAWCPKNRDTGHDLGLFSFPVSHFWGHRERCGVWGKEKSTESGIEWSLGGFLLGKSGFRGGFGEEKYTWKGLGG